MTSVLSESGRALQARSRSIAATLVVCIGIVVSTTAGAAEQSIWQREKLTGDWGGARTALADRGIEIGIAYINETFAVLSGGISRGGTYEGRGDFQIDADLEKLIGWTGGKLHARVFQIGKTRRNVADRVGSIADPSNIDATPTTRLFTAWFEQSFGSFASLRIGQLAADDEFLTSTTAGGLINGTFGWASITAANLPSGGAAYPLATPGARLQVNFNERISALVGVFSGDPAGRSCYDADPNANPQECNKHGTRFQFNDGAFWIGELQYQVNQGKAAKGLAAAYKLGVWYHSGRFADQRNGIDATGATVSLATSPPTTLYHRGNWGVYGVVDQMVWRGMESSVSVFTRAGAVPNDRNLVSWYVDGGVGIKGLLPGRADDTLTLGVAHINISNSARGLDQDTLLVNGPPYPIRSSETVFELSYIFQVAPWWMIQPDIQYIVRPGGNVADPNNAAATVGNAFIVGGRSTIIF
ncbi:MAG: carbohydrate porin [Pseudolabrys sp.]